MSEELQRLLDAARKVRMSSPDAERQRRSFAYGNTHFENQRISRATVDRAAEELNSRNGKRD